MSTAPRIIIVGHLTLDNMIRWPERNCYFAVPQGNALASALGAAMWGQEITVLSKRGFDYPDHAIDRMEAAQIQTTHIVRAEACSLGFWIIRDGPDIVHDFPLSTNNWELLTPRIDDLPTQLDCVVGVHICPMPIKMQIEMASHFHSLRKIVSVDCPPLNFGSHRNESIAEIRALANSAEIFTPSFLDLSNTFPTLDEPGMAAALVQIGFPIVAIKSGKRGSFVYCEGMSRPQHVPPVSVLVKEETGAGDAYSGAFLAQYINTHDIIDAARAATVAASFMIEDVGMLHAIPDKEELYMRYNNTVI